MSKLNNIEDQTYDLLYKQVEGLISNDNPAISNLANITAAIKQTFKKISWVGFYFVYQEMLYLGPFQGKVACYNIKFGEGVCGTAIEEEEVQIVPDVHKFPGHIACDAEANSEIVIPLIKDGEKFGVLDLDSYELNSFSELDEFWLKKICSMILSNISLKEIIFYK